MTQMAADQQSKFDPQRTWMAAEEFHRRIIEIGLMRQLPDTAADYDDADPDDESIAIKGEPLSETVIRERR